MTVFDIRQDAGSSKHGGKRWIDVFRSFVESLSGRSPSSWAPGTIEAQVVVEVDFGGGAELRTAPEEFDECFDVLGRGV